MVLAGAAFALLIVALRFLRDASGGAIEPQAAFRAIRDGGGFGSIIGRNSFQRKKADALKFLGTVMGIYAGTQK